MSELDSGFLPAGASSLLRRRAGIVWAAAVVGLLVAYLVVQAHPPTYRATALVAFDRADPIGDAAPDPLDLGTESELVMSDAVGRAVRDDLGRSGSNADLFRHLAVTGRDDARVLGLAYEADSATAARDTVNAIARAYLAERSDAATEQRTVTLEALAAEVADAEDALGQAEAEVAGSEPGTAAGTRAATEARLAQDAYDDLVERRQVIEELDPSAGEVVRQAALPDELLPRRALGTGAGAFGLVLVAGLGLAVVADRRDRLGGGRRRVEQLVPGATIRVLPTATDPKAPPAEVDAAIDRLAVELASGGSQGRAASALLVGTGTEPPVALAEELASSLTFAGIPALFVLAGSTDRGLRQAHVIRSFTDLVTGPSLVGPPGLPAVAGTGAVLHPPTVTWLRPSGSAEASGLLRRAVVEALITRAGREGFEAVVFVAATPTRNAAATALGQWVSRTAVVVQREDNPKVEHAVLALQEADVAITEVVWT